MEANSGSYMAIYHPTFIKLLNCQGMFIQFFVILCLKIFVMVSDVHKPNRLTNFVHKWVYVDVRVCVHVHMHAGNTMVLEGGKNEIKYVIWYLWYIIFGWYFKSWLLCTNMKWLMLYHLEVSRACNFQSLIQLWSVGQDVTVSSDQQYSSWSTYHYETSKRTEERKKISKLLMIDRIEIGD